MLEEVGNIWSKYDAAYPICITTNGNINSQGNAVMGRGTALQARIRCPKLPEQLARHILKNGNTVGYFSEYVVFTFPTKQNWQERSNINLIEKSACSLVKAVNYLGFKRVYLVRPGCNNGQLFWYDVKRTIAPILDNRFTIIDLDGEE